MSASTRKQQITDLFDRFAAKQNPWSERSTAYYRYLTKLVGRLAPAPGRVLELGSGDGDLLASLGSEQAIGVDLSPEMVELARQRHPDLVFEVGDAEEQRHDEPFNTVLMVNLIGLLDDVYAAFRTAHGSLDTRGRLIVVYYNHFWEPILRLASLLGLRAPIPYENWLPLSQVESLLHMTGFDVVRSGRRVLCPKFIPGLAWFLNTCIAPLPLFNGLALVEYVVARPLLHGHNAVSGAAWVTKPGIPERSPVPLRNGAANDNDLTCSIIIPTKDERGNIQAALDRTPEIGRRTELIFVDGNSTDGTVEEIERMIGEHPRRDIKFLSQGDGVGKGDAVRKGFDLATGDVLMILDSDLTMPPEDLPKYFEILASGQAEFVNGCRLVYPMEKEYMRFLNKIANHFFGQLFSWLIEQSVRDTLCGTKVLFRDDYRRIAANRGYFGDFDPFGDFDLLFGAARLNLKIADLPIRYRERTYGEIKIHRFRHGLLLLRMSLFAARKLKFF